MKVDVLKPYGFCAGVEYVINYLNKIVSEHPSKKIYCVGQLIHNKEVVSQIENKGIIVLYGDKNKSIDFIEDGVVVFSAHGTDESIKKKALNKGLIVYDAACPFVKKEIELVKSYISKGYRVAFIGVEGHDEANAVLSNSSEIELITEVSDVSKIQQGKKPLVVINQTTLSYNSLGEIHKSIRDAYKDAIFHDEICNASRIRQSKLLMVAGNYDCIIVVGDKGSNNTKTLYNLAKEKNNNVFFIEGEASLKDIFLDRYNSILIVSGSSTPRENVEKIEKKLKSL